MGLGTWGGFCTERARLDTFRGLGTERARLGTFNPNLSFRLFLKNLKKMYFFYSKRPPSPAKADVSHEKKCRFLLKKTIQPRKKMNFCMKNDKKMTKKTTQPSKN